MLHFFKLNYITCVSAVSLVFFRTYIVTTKVIEGMKLRQLYNKLTVKHLAMCNSLETVALEVVIRTGTISMVLGLRSEVNKFNH